MVKLEIFEAYREYFLESELPIKLDVPIALSILELNRKGYKTTACCSGHNKRTIDYAYIQFGFGELTPETLPPDWYWTDNGQQMEYAYKSPTGYDRRMEINRVMDDLFEWAKKLPDAS